MEVMEKVMNVLILEKDILEILKLGLTKMIQVTYFIKK